MSQLGIIQQLNNFVISSILVLSVATEFTEYYDVIMFLVHMFNRQPKKILRGEGNAGEFNSNEVRVSCLLCTHMTSNMHTISFGIIRVHSMTRDNYSTEGSILKSSFAVFHAIIILMKSRQYKKARQALWPHLQNEECPHENFIS